MRSPFRRAPRVTGMALDFKLGFRMLRRYPGLTLVGGLAIAFAICVGAGVFEFLTQVVYPRLPLPEGDRVVGIRQWDAEASRARLPAPRDFGAWRGELRSVTEVGAFRTFERNLIAPGLPIRPIEVVEMGAAGFRVARVPAAVGRTLVDEDERPGAPPVVVLGHDLWQRRFDGDPTIVGREIRLGSTVHTVVGVMPEGFAFPIAHEIWTPLRLNPLEYAPGQGPQLRVFGRLAPGATLDEAATELATLGRRATADFPDTHRHLRPQVLPYAHSIMGVGGPPSVGVLALNLFLVMLLVLVCGNVALLMFARAVSRESEIVVRSALGASRGHIVAQLFAEALVLAGVAAVVGLAATDFALRRTLGVLEAQLTQFPGLPFWIEDRVSPATLLYVALLTFLGALVVGVLPALKVTRALGPQLRRASAGGGGGGYRFGGVWTAVIVAQVAVTVAFPGAAFFLQRETARSESRPVGFATGEYLSARLEVDAEAAPGAPADTSLAARQARARAVAAELERRLEADPAVRAVTVAERLPRMDHPYAEVRVDRGGPAPADSAVTYRWVASTGVAVDYFQALGVRVLQGRGFHTGDLEPDARVVVVNQSFVQRVMGGRSPVGRHVRYLQHTRWDASVSAEREPWYEIVGVVPDLGMDIDPEGVYHPLEPGTAAPLHMAVHTHGDPAALAPRFRSLAAEVDPTLRLHDVVPLDDVSKDKLGVFLFWVIVLVSAVALLLSLAGIYAVMAFTVAQRTREIGIRVALGAGAPGIVRAVFLRPVVQVGLGIVAGTALVASFPVFIEMETLSLKAAVLVAAYAATMLAICMLACVVPTRRALGIEPTEALRAD